MEKVEGLTIGEKLVVTKGEQGDFHILHMAAETGVIGDKNIGEGTDELPAVGGSSKARVENLLQDENSSTDSGEVKPKPKPKEKPKTAKRSKRIVIEENFDEEEIDVAYSQAEVFVGFLDSESDSS